MTSCNGVCSCVNECKWRAKQANGEGLGPYTHSPSHPHRDMPSIGVWDQLPQTNTTHTAYTKRFSVRVHRTINVLIARPQHLLSVDVLNNRENAVRLSGFNHKTDPNEFAMSATQLSNRIAQRRVECRDICLLFWEHGWVGHPAKPCNQRECDET